MIDHETIKTLETLEHCAKAQKCGECPLKKRNLFSLWKSRKKCVCIAVESAVDTINKQSEKIKSLLQNTDAAGIKHGFWEHGDYYDMGDVCSNCQYDSCQQPCRYRYCPNCGSKMDGDKN